MHLVLEVRIISLQRQSLAKIQLSKLSIPHDFKHITDIAIGQMKLLCFFVKLNCHKDTPVVHLLLILAVVINLVILFSPPSRLWRKGGLIFLLIHGFPFFFQFLNNAGMLLLSQGNLGAIDKSADNHQYDR